MERPAPAPQGATGRYGSRRCLGNETITLTACPHLAVSTRIPPRELSQAATRAPWLVVTKHVFKKEMSGAE